MANVREKWQLCVKSCVSGFSPTPPYNMPSNAIQRHPKSSCPTPSPRRNRVLFTVRHRG